MCKGNFKTVDGTIPFCFSISVSYVYILYDQIKMLEDNDLSADVAYDAYS